MEYRANVNGIEVLASYGHESVEQIFLPLLRHLGEISHNKGSRVLAMLAAPPAAGKSTLGAFLEHLSRTTPGLCPLQAIGMDGFHRRQDYLETHTMVRDGAQVSMAQFKGAPETFDVGLLHAALESVASGEDCPWPAYDRTIHDPIDGALRVTEDIVLVEGNYLLLDWPDWKDLRSLADYTVAITADPEILRERLVGRKASSGMPYADAKAFVERSDLYNARTVLSHTTSPDLMLRLTANGEYVLPVSMFQDE
ncbi:MAG: nucleoside/nucleotide kinase family protein [Atopobiaceae bacterium]|nr:nucleoside/nucleotide kinase family protein [Atopobiaceae bacterium]